ncbi:repetitive organellar protein-like isoform X1 [Cydia strobilella]|uniref:repetitive organellar protein-like isoform X1 n=1 Tax=Cydia strobilella TaxID=1100964 RepID=UPI003005F40F
MGAGHSAEVEGGAYASDPPAHDRRKSCSRRRRHSVDSVASYSSQNHVDRIRTQNFSAASCQDEGDFGSIKTSLFRRSSSNLEYPHKRPESVTSNTSSTRSRLRELVERKSNQEEHKTAANTVGDIQYFENPTETLEFDKRRNSLESKKSQEERPKKRKLTKSKEKDKETCENKNKKHEKYQSKLAEYYKLPVQLPQDEFYQHLTRSKAAEELLQKRFSNSDTEFNGSYGRLCKHKEPEGFNLRRSRSLAVIREETFTDLQIQNHAKSKRSQLIPRARLFDKPCFKDRLPGRAKYQTKEEVLEGIYIDSTASCFGAINGQRENENHVENADRKSEKEDTVSRNESHHSRSISGSWPNLNDDLKPTNLSEDSIGHSRNPSEIDSLDSNYVRKHYNFEAHLKNYKDSSPDSERSVVTPDRNKSLYITDHDTDQEDRDRSKNNTPKSFTNDSLSITHSDKDKKDLAELEHVNNPDSYDEISIKSKRSEAPRIPESEDINLQIKDTQIKDAETQSVVSENDGTISSPPDSITSYISISIASSTDKSHKLEYLANSLAEKIDEYCESQFKENASVASHTINSENNNTESDPIYTQVNKKKTFADIRRDSFLSNKSNIFNEIPKKTNNEVFVTNTYIESDNYSTKSNCTSSKNITTEPFVTTLIENQYYSLPDINIGKCLRKSERIDAQLREEDQEDIPCENTYEIAQTHFREILSTKGNENYGQLNKTNVINNHNISNKTSVYLPDYREPQIIQSFTKLEDDLKSIITVDSSNADDKDPNFFRSDSHQNEREINEIEGTIRNNKLITKSESLKLTTNSIYRPEINIAKSFSHDNINKSAYEKKGRQGIRKHYSLRQRDPADDDIHRLPSPGTVERHVTRPCESTVKSLVSVGEGNTTPLLSRVQSFKTSAESNIAIVPLSGHQTIVIDPPLTQDLKEKSVKPIAKSEVKTNQLKANIDNLSRKESIKPAQESLNDKNKEGKTKNGLVDNSSYWIPKDPFITIKLNKVVKTTIPKLKKDSSERIASVQYKFEKPPPRLIIKDNKQTEDKENVHTVKENPNMTRPQILQVTDSKNKKQSDSTKLETKKKVMAENTEVVHTTKSEIMSESKEEIREIKSDNTVKEKLNNAIKTDIEYQEKLHSVKNYWSKLIDKSPETKDNGRTECKLKTNENVEAEAVVESEKGTPEEPNCSTEISVCNIIKSLESVKIVDSIRKLSQTKIQLWKDESEKVKSDSEIEETAVKKIVKDCESNIYEKPTIKNKKTELDLCRDTPEIEIVELSCDDNQNQKTQATLIKAKGFDKECDEFDHVRYKVMKSELFKNSMIANYRKEAQFDGLLQYLQDYSFQELLVNNNIVIIEPVRTKIEPVPRNQSNSDTRKIPPTLLKKNDNSCSHVDRSKNAIRRHFFYHPIRVNKEIIEEELPNPDTVKKVRNLFEDTLKMKSPMTMIQDPPLVEENVGLTRRATSYRNLNEESKNSKIGGRKKVIRQLTIETNFGNKKWDNASLSSGVSSGDLSSNNDYENDALSPYSNKNLKDNVYSSSDEYLCDSVSHDFCCESQYVSPDIMKKIRECGTSVTYYGGKVLNSKPGSTVSPMTKAIMEEIKGLQKNCSRDCYSCQTKCRGDKCSCLAADKHKPVVSDKQSSNASSDSGNPDPDKNKRSENFPNFKFKLVKSNSCSSRLELTGTDDNKNPRMKYRSPSKQRKADDPPLMNDDENSVKNKICRLESYNKGIAKTPFEKKDNEDNKIKHAPSINNKLNDTILKHNIVHPQQGIPTIPPKNEQEPEIVDNKNVTPFDSKPTDPHSFEKKYYYVNENLEQSKIPPGKFGEMVFEEFEVLESCYDSLNSNKSLK